MLYVGLFSFYEDVESRSCNFVYFAEASDPEAVVDVFKVGILKMSEQQEPGIYGEIYFHSFIELKELPPGGAMAFYQSMNEHEASSVIYCALPRDNTGLQSFSWAEDGKGPDDDPTPFLTIPRLK